MNPSPCVGAAAHRDEQSVTAPFLVSADTIERDPRFPSALLRFCEDVASFHLQQSDAARLFADLGQFAIVAAIVAPTAAPTEAALVRSAGALASRRRIRAQLAALEASGMIAREGGDDARERPVVPTEALKDALDAWVIAIAGTAASFAGLDDAVRRRGIGRDYLRQIMATHALGFSAFQTLPAVSRLMTLTRGHVLLTELLRARLETGSREIPFSRRSFGAAYGVSRSHAIDLLRECEALGLVSPAARGRLHLSTTFDQELTCWGAINFALAAATLRGQLLEVIKG